MRDFSSDHRWLSLNTATVRKQGDLVEIIDACARHGIRAIDPWRDQVATVGLDRAARAVRDAGLDLSGYCRGGMFPSDAARRSEVRDDNRRCVDEAKALGASCLVLVVGGLPQYSRPGSAASKDIVAARAQVEDGSGRLLEYASRPRMPLAIEPLHPAYAADRACVNTTKQALDICDRLDPQRTGALGVALDVYHVWWDPELDGADRARRQGSAARLPCLRLAGADAGYAQRPRHDGRRRHRHQIGPRARSRRRALPAIRRSRSSPMTGGRRPMDEVLRTCIETAQDGGVAPTSVALAARELLPRVDLARTAPTPAEQRAGWSTPNDEVDSRRLSGRMSSSRCRSLATVIARSDAVISGIRDQQARRMYLCLMMLNGPDVQSSGPLS